MAGFGIYLWSSARGTGAPDPRAGADRITAELDIGKLLSLCLVHLERDFTLEQSSDSGRIEALMPRLGKTLVSPTLSAARNDFSEANAFWLAMFRGDEPVAVMGMRRDDPGREPVDAFWARLFGRHYGSEAGTSVELDLPQAVRMIRGPIVYMGDLHFRPDIRGSRPNLMAFVHLAHCLCFIKWPEAGWIYAFHRREDVLSGHADRYGFNNRWPGAQVWRNPPDYRSSDEYLSVLSREEFEQKARYYARNRALLLAEDPRAKKKREPKS